MIKREPTINSLATFIVNTRAASQHLISHKWRDVKGSWVLSRLQEVEEREIRNGVVKERGELTEKVWT